MVRKDEARFLREFLAEAEDLLARAGRYVEELREVRDEPHPEVVNALFRAVHSLKGLAGMVGVSHLTDAAHAFESVLDGVRMGRVPVDARTLSASSAAVGALEAMVRALAQGAANPEPPRWLEEQMRLAVEPRNVKAHDSPSLALPDSLATLLTDYERHRLQEAQSRARKVLLLPLSYSFDAFDEGLRKAMAEVRARGELIGTFPGTSADPDQMSFLLLAAIPSSGDEAELASLAGAETWELLSTRTEPTPVEPAASAAAAAAETELALSLPRFSTDMVRVPLEKVGNLLTLAGDLALSARTLEQALGRVLPQVSDRMLRHDVQKSVGELQRAAAALSRAALGVRLVPVEQLADRLTRAVKSIASSLGKDVELEVVGGETEIDKVLADELAEPLLHIFRNAVGHGIESPSARRAAGKPAAGQITLSAETRGRQVLLTISDDGRGMDPAALVRRARERGLLLPEEPDPADPLELVFLPGFSTATAVSEVSGRGVGLDVVRSTLASWKGVVSTRSELGAGTSFEVLVPVTLALVESLLVRASGRFFALPTSAVVRTFALDTAPGPGATTIDEEGEIRLIPLAGLLGLAGDEDGRTVVVAEQGGLRAGFIVSCIERLADLVVKPIPDEIPRAPEVTGAAELPDGELALVLDAGQLLARALGLRKAA